MFSFLLGIVVGWYVEGAQERIAAFIERVRSWL